MLSSFSSSHNLCEWSSNHLVMLMQSQINYKKVLCSNQRF
uniref:Uncharacterized protein n=1 Tax=Rhizophora mucronata TaxID=61149 RepID=A0A2P2IP35_RHIMU